MIYNVHSSFERQCFTIIKRIKMSEEPKKIMSFRLHNEEKIFIERVARKLDVTPSHILRKLIRKEMNNGKS